MRQEIVERAGLEVDQNEPLELVDMVGQLAGDWRRLVEQEVVVVVDDELDPALRNPIGCKNAKKIYINKQQQQR